MNRTIILTLLFVALWSEDRDVSVAFSSSTWDPFDHYVTEFTLSSPDSIEIFNISFTGFGEIISISGGLAEEFLLPPTLHPDSTISLFFIGEIPPGEHHLATINFSYPNQDFLTCITGYNALMSNNEIFSDHDEVCIVPTNPDTTIVDLPFGEVDITYSQSVSWLAQSGPYEGDYYFVVDSPDWVDAVLTYSDFDDYQHEWTLSITGMPDEPDYGESVVTIVNTLAGGIFTFVPQEIIQYQFSVYESLLLGDINQDGSVAIDDIVWLVSLVLNDDPLLEYFMLLADCSQDNAIDILDIVCIILQIL